MTILGAQILVLAAFLFAWQEVKNLGLVSTVYISSPSAVASEWWKLAVTDGTLWSNAYATFIASFEGFGIGVVLGVVAGAVLARCVTIDRIIDPYLSFLNGLPRVALAPLFVLWFGIGLEGKVFMAVSLVFFVMLIATRAAMRDIDPDLLTIGRLMGARSWQLFFGIRLRGAAPAIFGAMRLSWVYALLGVIVGEFIAANKGLGQLVSQYSGSFNTAGTFAVLITIGVAAFLVTGVIAFAETQLFKWREE